MVKQEVLNELVALNSQGGIFRRAFDGSLELHYDLPAKLAGEEGERANRKTESESEKSRMERADCSYPDDSLLGIANDGLFPKLYLGTVLQPVV